jgi:hypothetical protein
MNNDKIINLKENKDNRVTYKLYKIIIILIKNEIIKFQIIKY